MMEFMQQLINVKMAVHVPKSRKSKTSLGNEAVHTFAVQISPVKIWVETSSEFLRKKNGSVDDKHAGNFTNSLWMML